MLHYLLFDVLGVGPLRVKYGVPYPKTTGPEPFERAFRAQQNQVEQMTPFLALLWVCSIFFNPTFAGSVGAIWVVCRMAYSFLYRLGTSSRRALIFTTIPAYLCLVVLAFGALFGIVRRQTGRAELAWAVITLLVGLYAALTIAHRRFLGRPSRETPSTPPASAGAHPAAAK
jgi:glutathione S-transferase